MCSVKIEKQHYKLLPWCLTKHSTHCTL